MVQKRCKIFKPRLLNVLSTRASIVKKWLSLCLVGCVRFARYHGKMYSHHPFYGALLRVFSFLRGTNSRLQPCFQDSPKRGYTIQHGGLHGWRCAIFVSTFI